MQGKLNRGNKLSDDVFIEYASYLADDGKIPECLETLYYAFQNFPTTIPIDKILPVVAKFIDKLKLETRVENASFEFSRNIYSCPSCCGVLHEPITIPCGHTYCKRCLYEGNVLCKVCHCQFNTDDREFRLNVVITFLVNKFWGTEIKGVSLRTQGNLLFKEKKLEESLRLYTEAVNYAPNDHLLLSNRCHVLLTLNRPKEALEDANAAVHYRPQWAKGHFRRATSLLALGKKEEALVAMLLCACLENSKVIASVRVDIAKIIILLIKDECQRVAPGNRHLTDLGNLPHKEFENNQNSGEENKEAKTERDRLTSPRNVSKSTFFLVSQHLPFDEVPVIRRIISKFSKELKNINSIRPTCRRSIDKDKIMKSDFECTLCYLLFWQPVSTPCGHTFCRSCLDRCLDHSPTCPLCKSSLVHYLAERRSNTTKFIDDLMKRYLPNEVQERVAQYEKELSEFALAGRDSQHAIPIFVATVAIPYIVCPLHVYEPRYRLMIRRCMETGTREFGMCVPSETGENGYANYGTMLEIKEIKYTQDGRSIINTVGSRRFKCISKSTKDGYNTATVEFLQDDEVPVSLLEDLQKMHNFVHEKANEWFLSIDRATQRRILSHYGSMPLIEPHHWKLTDGPTWLWWLIAVLPLEPAIQIRIIKECSLRTRLDLTKRILRCVYLHQSKN